eukprot:TRINITY_DN13436_c0_g1_i1.p1 TRINITY_DN13436_c0_g1~~TRINITY_DN13436_c0_g1_i1.p1  ORF type:complete len:227 (+),score=32.14 TRINITY_DN13436_c0_g1_i1:213-893(+)
MKMPMHIFYELQVNLAAHYKMHPDLNSQSRFRYEFLNCRLPFESSVVGNIVLDAAQKYITERHDSGEFYSGKLVSDVDEWKNISKLKTKNYGKQDENKGYKELTSDTTCTSPPQGLAVRSLEECHEECVKSNGWGNSRNCDYFAYYPEQNLKNGGWCNLHESCDMENMEPSHANGRTYQCNSCKSWRELSRSVPVRLCSNPLFADITCGYDCLVNYEEFVRLYFQY